MKLHPLIDRYANTHAGFAGLARFIRSGSHDADFNPEDLQLAANHLQIYVVLRVEGLSHEGAYREAALFLIGALEETVEEANASLPEKQTILRNVREARKLFP